MYLFVFQRNLYRLNEIGHDLMDNGFIKVVESLRRLSSHISLIVAVNKNGMQIMRPTLYRVRNNKVSICVRLNIGRSFF